MQVARASACSTLLADGRLLVAGGNGASGALDSVEVIGRDGAFHPAGHLLTPRADAACVTLPDGRVLVSGGTNAGKTLDTAELFDPAAGEWRRTGPMHSARSGQQMAATTWGAVVVAGGERTGGIELYLPGEGSFRSVGRLSSARLSGAVAALPGRRVAFLGGSDGHNTLGTIDIYDGNTNTVKSGGSMLQARREFTAAPLMDGRIWIAGGLDAAGNALASTEIFDPALGASTAGPDLPEARWGHAAHVLPHNNNVLVIGGRTASGPASTTALYGYLNGMLTNMPPMATLRHEMAASPFGLGALMVAGGRNDDGFLAGSELFRFATIQPDKPMYGPGESATFHGTGWVPGERVSIEVMGLPADARGALFSGSTVADRSGRLQMGGVTIDRGRSGGLQVIATGSGSAAADPMILGDNTAVNLNAPSPAPPSQYGDPVTFTGTVVDTSNPSTTVNGGTVAASYNGADLPGGVGLVPVAADGTFTFTFNASTMVLPKGANTNLIGFRFTGFTGSTNFFSSAVVLTSYLVTQRQIAFNIQIGQPGDPNTPPPPGNHTIITASTPQVAGSFPCGAVQLCITNVCSGPFQLLTNGSTMFDLPAGLTNGATVAVQYQDTCDSNFVSPPSPVPYVYVFSTTTQVNFLSGSTPVTSISFGNPITWVAPVNAADICTGFVQFSVNGSPVGGPVGVIPGAVSGCTATFFGGFLPVGVYTVTAAYLGDTFNLPSTGTNVFNVSPANLPPLGGNDRVQVFTAPSIFSLTFGVPGTGAGQMITPCGLAVNPANNNIFVSDYANSRIEIWSSTGQWIGTFGTAGTGTGHMLSPCGLAFAPNGYLYVADSGNNRVDIFTPIGSTGTSWNFAGWFGGQGITQGKMMAPFGVAILPGTSSSNFTVYVADTANNRVETFTPYGGYLSTFGQTGTGTSQFITPTSLAFTLTGNLMVVDFGNNRVEIFTSGGSYIGKFGDTGQTVAQLLSPFGIAVCPQAPGAPYAGMVMVTDSGHSRVAIYTATGAYSKQYGVFGTAHGQFEMPVGIAFMPNGYQVVSESGPKPPGGDCGDENCIAR